MFWCNVFRTKNDLVVAVCDQRLLGQKLNYKEVKVVLNERFYGGKLVDAEVVQKLLTKATIGNLFGREIIALAEKNGFITSENVITIDGVPHAQFIKLK